jgi:hypothetical protein
LGLRKEEDKVPEIEFSQHAIDQMTDRGTTKEEIKSAILDGEQVPAKKGRKAYRKNIPFDSQWKGKYFLTKQVMPIVKEESARIIVITVYVFYFGGKK